MNKKSKTILILAILFIFMTGCGASKLEKSKQAIRSQNYKKAEELIEQFLENNPKSRQANLIDRYISSEDEMLHEAIRENSLEAVKLFVEIGIDVDQEGYSGTPLFVAVKKGNLKIARYLISAGADVNYQNDRGITPLMLSAKYGRLHMVEKLIASQTDVNKKSENGMTALMYAASRSPEQHSFDAINDKKLVIASLLIDSGAKVNSRDNDKKTALMLASKNRRTNMARLLVESGADIQIEDESGHSAWFYASQALNLRTVRLFKSKFTPLASKKTNKTESSTNDNLHNEYNKNSKPTNTIDHKGDYALLDSKARGQYRTDNGKIQKIQSDTIQGVVEESRIRIEPAEFSPTQRIQLDIDTALRRRPAAVRLQLKSTSTPLLIQLGAASYLVGEKWVVQYMHQKGLSMGTSRRLMDRISSMVRAPSLPFPMRYQLAVPDGCQSQPTSEAKRYQRHHELPSHRTFFMVCQIESVLRSQYESYPGGFEAARRHTRRARERFSSFPDRVLDNGHYRRLNDTVAVVVHDSTLDYEKQYVGLYKPETSLAVVEYRHTFWVWQRTLRQNLTHAYQYGHDNSTRLLYDGLQNNDILNRIEQLGQKSELDMSFYMRRYELDGRLAYIRRQYVQDHEASLKTIADARRALEWGLTNLDYVQKLRAVFSSMETKPELEDRFRTMAARRLLQVL